MSLDAKLLSNQDLQKPINREIKQQLSFEELLETYDAQPLQKGQFVEGEILQIDDNVILANVDSKRTAVVPRQDIEKMEEDELAQLSVGDEVILYVLHTPVGDEELLVSLNRGLEQQDWINATEYEANEELLELEVIGHNRGGLLVQFGHLQGFVPRSQVPHLQHAHSEDMVASRKAKLVGKELPLKVIEVDRHRRRLILSAKKAQKELRQQRLQELKAKEGETITGRITSLVKFGAFVDLNGVEGLIHISEIAHQKVTKPEEFLTPGEMVDISVLSVDIEQERVSLSRKALLPSPWDQFAEEHTAGDLVEGVVTNVTDFGAFLAITEGIEGLLHVSEMRGTQDFSAQDLLYPGDVVLVRILDIQPQRQRLGLSQHRIGKVEEMQWIWQRQQAAAPLDEEEE